MKRKARERCSIKVAALTRRASLTWPQKVRERHKQTIAVNYSALPISAVHLDVPGVVSLIPIIVRLRSARELYGRARRFLTVAHLSDSDGAERQRAGHYKKKKKLPPLKYTRCASGAAPPAAFSMTNPRPGVCRVTPVRKLSIEIRIGCTLRRNGLSPQGGAARNK